MLALYIGVWSHMYLLPTTFISKSSLMEPCISQIDHMYLPQVCNIFYSNQWKFINYKIGPLSFRMRLSKISIKTISMEENSKKMTTKYTQNSKFLQLHDVVTPSRKTLWFLGVSPSKYLKMNLLYLDHVWSNIGLH